MIEKVHDSPLQSKQLGNSNDHVGKAAKYLKNIEYRSEKPDVTAS